MEILPSEADADGAIKMLLYNHDVLLAHGDGLLLGELVPHVVKTQSEVILNGSLILPGKNGIEILFFLGRERSMGVGTQGRLYTKLFVELRNEDLFKESISFFHGRDGVEPQFFDESVLEGTKQSFHPSLGLRGMSENGLNPEFAHGSLKLSFQIVVLYHPSLRHLVGGKLVHVNTVWFAVGEEILTPEGKHRRHSFVERKLRLRDASGGIINGG